MNMKVIIPLLAGLVLVGCDASMVGRTALENRLEKRDTEIGENARHFVTPQGLECVRFGWFNRGGVSCNWDKYNKEQSTNNE